MRIKTKGQGTPNPNPNPARGLQGLGARRQTAGTAKQEESALKLQGWVRGSGARMVSLCPSLRLRLHLSLTLSLRLSLCPSLRLRLSLTLTS